MRGIFNSDSRLMRMLSKLFDIGYLSIVFILFCVPVITGGAALTALYYTSVKVIRRDRGYVFQEFWRSFKLNFVQATKMWLVELVLMLLLIYNLTVVTGFVSGIYLAMAILILSVCCYAYPLLSRFTMKNTDIIKMSIILMVKHIYFTIPFLIITVIAGVGIIFLIPYLPIVPLLVPGLSALLYSYMMEIVMKKYMKKPASGAAGSGAGGSGGEGGAGSDNGVTAGTVDGESGDNEAVIDEWYNE